MRLWLDGTPGLDDPPEELAQKAWRALTSRPGAGELNLPVYSYGGLSVRIRFVHELPSGREAHLRAGEPPSFPGPAISTLAWFWVHVLEGLLWENAGQVGELHVRREWGRVAGVEVSL
jgi:hypothetical protein